jgi:hypothetical protein
LANATDILEGLRSELLAQQWSLAETVAECTRVERLLRARAEDPVRCVPPGLAAAAKDMDAAVAQARVILAADGKTLALQRETLDTQLGLCALAAARLASLAECHGDGGGSGSASDGSHSHARTYARAGGGAGGRAGPPLGAAWTEARMAAVIDFAQARLRTQSTLDLLAHDTLRIVVDGASYARVARVATEID